MRYCSWCFSLIFHISRQCALSLPTRSPQISASGIIFLPSKPDVYLLFPPTDSMRPCQVINVNIFLHRSQIPLLCFIILKHMSSPRSPLKSISSYLAMKTPRSPVKSSSQILLDFQQLLPVYPWLDKLLESRN